jgi:CheY-like chemotaxis protein
MMPEMDGYEVCKRFRNHPILQAIPIIVVSARTEQSAIEKALNVGASAYLTKPINLPKLTSEIQRLTS